MSDPVLEEVRNFYDANHEGLERARRARRYGETKISRFRHGALLLRMRLFAARKLKFR